MVKGGQISNEEVVKIEWNDVVKHSHSFISNMSFTKIDIDVKYTHIIDEHLGKMPIKINYSQKFSIEQFLSKHIKSSKKSKSLLFHRMCYKLKRRWKHIGYCKGELDLATEEVEQRAVGLTKMPKASSVKV